MSAELEGASKAERGQAPMTQLADGSVFPSPERSESSETDTSDPTKLAGRDIFTTTTSLGVKAA